MSKKIDLNVFYNISIFIPNIPIFINTIENLQDVFNELKIGSIVVNESIILPKDKALNKGYFILQTKRSDIYNKMVMEGKFEFRYFSKFYNIDFIYVLQLNENNKSISTSPVNHLTLREEEFPELTGSNKSSKSSPRSATPPQTTTGQNFTPKPKHNFPPKPPSYSQITQQQQVINEQQQVINNLQQTINNLQQTISQLYELLQQSNQMGQQTNATCLMLEQTNQKLLAELDVMYLIKNIDKNLKNVIIESGAFTIEN